MEIAGNSARTSTLGELVLRHLQRASVREIFGIPGDFILPFFKVMEDSKAIPFYTLSHEPALGFAADAATRWHGNPSAAVVTYGAGALNMVNPIAAAYAEKSPVIVISGGPGISEDHTELLLHHQAKRLDSQAEIFREVTCAQTRLSNLRQADRELGRVLEACRRFSRPVYIELPRDLVAKQVPGDPGRDDVVQHVQPRDLSAAVKAAVDEVLERIHSARSPVILVGVEVRRFGLEAEVANLATRLNIPVVTSFMGRGLMLDTSAPPLGTYLGIAGEPALTDLVEQSDALVMLGVILSDTNLGISSRKLDLRSSIRVHDEQVSLGYHVYHDISIRSLLEEMNSRDLAPMTTLDPATPASCSLSPSVDGDDLTPDVIAAVINQFRPNLDALIVAADVGDALFTSMSIHNVPIVTPGYYASMGFSVPAALGLQVASQRRPLVLVGDGAFQMTGWELGNCTRYGWDPVVVVLNNSSWEMLRVFQPESHFNNLNEWNFAKLGEALGGEGVRVSSREEFTLAFQRAWQRRGRFQLIEAMLPRGVHSQVMSRYAAALKKRRESEASLMLDNQLVEGSSPSGGT